MSRINLEDAFNAVSIVLFVSFSVWLCLWVLTILMWMATSTTAYERCEVRGYKNVEVVVNYPKFWKAHTVCYKSDALEKGTEL